MGRGYLSKKLHFAIKRFKTEGFFHKRHLVSLVHFGALIIICLSSLSYLFSEINFIANLFTHYQLQYVVVLVIFSLILLVLRQFRMAFISVFYSLFIFFYFIYPFEYLPKKLEQTDVFFMNVYGKKNTEMKDIYKEIIKHSPSVVALVEASDLIVEPLSKIYGKPDISVQKDYFRCVVFSDKKIINVRKVKSVQGLNTPLCQVEFDDYILIVVHTYSPVNPTVWEKNKDDLYAIKKYLDILENKDKSYLVVGDFNSTVYSQPFRTIFEKYVEKNLYTWQTGKVVTIPLDHVFSNMSFQHHRIERYSSDHAGLIIDLK